MLGSGSTQASETSLPTAQSNLNNSLGRIGRLSSRISSYFPLRLTGFTDYTGAEWVTSSSC
jgi:hypothetical protein